MGFFSRVWKGIKKVVKKIGKGIKKVFKKIGGAFGKLGILGHIGLMFLMPYAGQLWGSLGKFGTTLVNGTSVAGKAFGHVMRGVYHAGKAVGTVYKTITGAVEGSLKWMGNRMGNFLGKTTDIFTDPFANLQEVFGKTDSWLKEGWAGTNEMASQSVLKAATEKAVVGEAIDTSKFSVQLDDELLNIGGGIPPESNLNLGSSIDTDSLSLLDKVEELGGKGVDKLKEKIRDLPETYIEGAVSGVEEAGQRLILGSPKVGNSYQTQLSFGSVGLNDKPFLDDLETIYQAQPQTAGHLYGSESLNSYSMIPANEDTVWKNFMANAGVSIADPLSKMYYNQSPTG